MKKILSVLLLMLFPVTLQSLALQNDRTVAVFKDNAPNGEVITYTFVQITPGEFPSARGSGVVIVTETNNLGSYTTVHDYKSSSYTKWGKPNEETGTFSVSIETKYKFEVDNTDVTIIDKGDHGTLLIKDERSSRSVRFKVEKIK